MNSHETVRTQSDRAPAEIEAEIDQQRRHIEDIVGALEHKLTPSQLMHQATEAAKTRARTTVDGMMGGTLDTIKANPLPAALAAAGAAWLLASRDKETPLVVAHEHRNSAIPALLTAAGIAWLVKQARSRTTTTEIEVDAALLETATGPSVVAIEEVEIEGPGLRDRAAAGLHTASARAGATVDEAKLKASAAYGSAKTTAADTVDSARLKAHQAADSAKAKAHSAADAVSSRAHSAADTVSTKAHQTTEAAKAKAQYAATAAREKARHAGESMSRMLEEHPLAVGLAAVAAGALLGSLLPPTRKENELMGEKRDELARRAKEMARTGMQEAKATAQEVAAAAADAMESQSSGSKGSSSSTTGSSASGSTGSSLSGSPASVTITEKTTVSASVPNPGSQRAH